MATWRYGRGRELEGSRREEASAIVAQFISRLPLENWRNWPAQSAYSSIAATPTTTWRRRFGSGSSLAIGRSRRKPPRRGGTSILPGFQIVGSATRLLVT